MCANMFLGWAFLASLEVLATAFASDKRAAISASGDCVECPHPPARRETYCAASIPSSQNYSQPTENADLVAVQVIIRHGDRAPLVTTPYWDVTWDCAEEQRYSFLSSNVTGVKPERALITREVTSLSASSPFSWAIWRGSCDVGQLTPRGAAAMKMLGTRLREIYVDKLQFLPGRAQESGKIYVRSTDFSRAKQSASRVLAGMYPDRFRTDGSIFNVVTVPKTIEYMHPNAEQCPAQMRILRKLMKSKTFKSHMKRHRPLLRKLRTIFGPAESSYWPGGALLAYFEYLAPRVCHQMPIPCDPSLQTCLTDAEIAAAMRAADWETTYAFRDSPLSRSLTRLIAGSFLAELLARMKHHADASAGMRPGHHEGRFEIYSAHGETLASLLGGVHARENRVPAYGSNLIIELWKRRRSEDGEWGRLLSVQDPEEVGRPVVGYDDYFVRVLHNGRPLDVQWCDMNWCPARVIWEDTKQQIPRDVKEECRAKKIKDRDDDREDD